MSMIRTRRAESEDFVRLAPSLLPLYASDPDLEPCLPKVWTRLLDSGAMIGGVVERLEADKPPVVVAFGASVFPTDAFLAPFRKGERTRVAPAVAREVLASGSGLLNATGIRVAQAQDRLTMLILHSAYPGAASGTEIGVPDDLAHYEALAGLLMQEVRGLRFRRIDAEVHGPGMFSIFESSGLRAVVGGLPSLDHPVFMSVTREDVRDRPGIRIASAFAHVPPRVPLRPIYGDVVREALQGKSDAAIAESLGVSLSAVKHRWGGLYRLLDEEHPGLVPDLPRSDPFEGGRGSERRRHVLAYFRAHPENLR